MLVCYAVKSRNVPNVIVPQSVAFRLAWSARNCGLAALAVRVVHQVVLGAQRSISVQVSPSQISHTRNFARPYYASGGFTAPQASGSIRWRRGQWIVLWICPQDAASRAVRRGATTRIQKVQVYQLLLSSVSFLLK